jgi:hypothetical protein
MSVFQPGNVAYGFSQSLLTIPNQPIVAQRNPTVNDKANIGTIWINQTNNNAYIITSIVDNVATWLAIGTTTDANVFDTDSGTAIPVAGVIVIHGGSNINTSGATNVVTVNLNNSILLPATTSDASSGVISIGGDRFAYAFPTTNTFLGCLSGNLSLNVGLALGNTAVGYASLTDLTTGPGNVAVGSLSLTSDTSGENNCAIGAASLSDVITGSNNTALGYFSGANYTGSESSNIVIGSRGTAAESNVIRIGTQGSGSAQQDACYIAGIVGVTVSNQEFVTINSSTGQLGVSATGGGIVTLDGNSGSATGATVTIEGGNNITTAGAASTLTVNVSGTTDFSLLTGNGTGSISSLGIATNGELPIGSTGANPVLATLTAGSGINITNGAGSITIAATGSGIVTLDGDTGSATGATVTIETNPGVNYGSLSFSGAGSTLTLNTSTPGETVALGKFSSITYGASAMIGFAAGGSTGGGSQCVAVGFSALGQLVGGTGNTAVGYTAGNSYTAAEAGNICIGHSVVGVGGESNTTRLGVQGTQTACYIAGIYGETVGVSGTAVFVDNTGLLGSTVSSRRYKDLISDMDTASDPILNLHPVTFVYKNDSSRTKQFGLIAEEVEEIMPELVSYNKDGDPETVHYHTLPVLLLNHIQKQHNIIAELSRRLERLESRSKYESKS